VSLQPCGIAGWAEGELEAAGEAVPVAPSVDDAAPPPPQAQTLRATSATSFFTPSSSQLLLCAGVAVKAMPSLSGE
jgi:hypothetical protein